MHVCSCVCAHTHVLAMQVGCACPNMVARVAMRRPDDVKVTCNRARLLRMASHMDRASRCYEKVQHQLSFCIYA